MRFRWLSLTALLVGSAVAIAQAQVPQQPGQQHVILQQPVPQPAQRPEVDPANNPLDAVLLRWEKAMNDISSLHATVKRTAVDKVFATTEVFEGEAKYVKPNKASLFLQNMDPKKKGEFERIVCNGQIAYKWEPSKKEIHIHELPKPKQGQINDDNFVSMLFGMKAVAAKRRYDLKLVGDPTGKNYYYYILVEPRDPQDQAEFTKGRLTLTVTTCLPREIWYEQPNGNVTVWDFPKMAVNVPLDNQWLKEFAQPQPPAGWQLKRVVMPQEASGAPAPANAPRVIRP